MTEDGGQIGADGPLCASLIGAGAPKGVRGPIGVECRIGAVALTGAAGPGLGLMAARTEDEDLIDAKGLTDAVDPTDADGVEINV